MNMSIDSTNKKTIKKWKNIKKMIKLGQYKSAQISAHMRCSYCFNYFNSPTLACPLIAKKICAQCVNMSDAQNTLYYNVSRLIEYEWWETDKIIELIDMLKLKIEELE